MNIVVMGPQGSGKTTQAQLLAQSLNILHISTGDVYREIAQQDSPLGLRVKNLLDNGQLIDDETTFEVIDNKLGKIESGFVVDGFPRTLTQAQRNPFKISHVIVINLSDEECVKRLVSRGRYDDTQELIVERLRLFHEETEPIVAYYRNLYDVIDIDGNQPVNKVHEDILAKLKEHDQN